MEATPGSKAARWMEREASALLATYAKLPIVLERGEGSEVIDTEGRRYLDLYGGHAVTLIGHGHPVVAGAIARQARELTFYSNVCYSPVRARAAERFLEHCYPGRIERAFFSSSGAEANETALKIARRATGRKRIVSMTQGFHGRTLGVLSVTGVDGMRESMQPNLDEYTSFVPFGDLEALEPLPGEEVAAVILEPIQSMAGVRLAADRYHRGLRDWCRRHGTLLIFDEVQTAPARTGRWFFGEHVGVEPDLVTTAKAIGGGFPVGVVGVSSDLAAQVKVGEQGTTFGGGPMACAAVDATLRVIEDEGLVERAAALGERFRKAIEGIDIVKEVRGMGLLIGIECSRPARDVRDRLLEQGILVGTSMDPNTIRLLPAATLGEEVVERLAAGLSESR